MTKKTPKINNSEGPNAYVRDEHGLLKNTQYIFNEDGSINWRSMVGTEHLFPNKGWFQQRSQDMPNSIEGLRDDQLLIKLSGIKELARLRGFDNISYWTEKCELDHVAVNCTINFIGNYETGGQPVNYQDMANATLDNTYDFGQNFLETIACNRAFVRCVRNFLNIHIVGSDEIGPAPSQKKTGKPGVSPQSMLESHFDGDFENFKSLLRDFWQAGTYQNDSIKTWSNFSDIPTKEARTLLGLVKNK
tara:strand:+ start:20 stop:760 length:741 start_codon:yes stop_codon:yes gene_type:complete